MIQYSRDRVWKFPPNGFNFFPKSCYFLIPVQFLHYFPLPWAPFGLHFNFSVLTLLSQISVSANFKRKHIGFIRLLNDIHSGSILKALDAFKTFFIIILNKQCSLPDKMDLPELARTSTTGGSMHLKDLFNLRLNYKKSHPYSKIFPKYYSNA